MKYKEEAFTGKIRLFLSGEMTDKERIEFENLMNKDDSLRDEVELQRGLTQYMQDRGVEKLKDRVKAIREKQENQTSFNWRKAIAAVLILGLLSIPVYFFVSNNGSPTPVQLADKYFEPDPNRITEMGGTADSLARAMSFYDKKEYSEAAKILKEIQSDSADYVTLYLSICQFENDKPLDAIATLKQGLYQLNEEAELKSVLQWYLILSYLKSNNEKQAKLELKKFFQKDYRFNLDKAQSLAEELDISK